MKLECGLSFWSVRIPFSVVSFIDILANSVTSKEEKIMQNLLIDWMGGPDR